MLLRRIKNVFNNIFEISLDKLIIEHFKNVIITNKLIYFVIFVIVLLFSFLIIIIVNY